MITKTKCWWSKSTTPTNHFLVGRWLTFNLSSMISTFLVWLHSLYFPKDVTKVSGCQKTYFALWWLMWLLFMLFCLPTSARALKLFLQGKLDHKSTRHLCHTMAWIGQFLVLSYWLWAEDLCRLSQGTPKQYHNLGWNLKLIWEVFLVSLLLARW